MKRTITFLIAIIGITFIMSSCASTKSTTARVIDITQTGVVQAPVVVDLVVGETKISGTASGNTTARASVQQSAVANALKNAKADVLIEPSYSIETFGSKITVTVVGFPGTYKNFRPMKEKDINLLQKYNSTKVIKNTISVVK